ncbi:small integral membrane protein 32-like [Phyllopteryx taeniolatus]|uniref:small integral membrane protein 32-like n=1 Tax=Phyllopteryx taeniolatus TaxID=161469 RepID=UPI002AD2A64B|nr:small integral membrane protein 32-like [Phyllopteryx taeniolatus]
MLKQVLLNSTISPHLGLVLMAQSSASTPAAVNLSHGSLVSVAALLRPTAGRGGGGGEEGGGGGGGGLRDVELQKPDLLTYVVMCLLLFLLVLIIVFFINCQLRNSFFASMPYDRSLREARTSYK